MRHGNPKFYELIDEMAKTHEIKSHDYASDSNPSGNYHFAGKIASLFAHSHEDAGFVGRIAEKIYRLANLESSQKNPKNESIEDTEKDIAVITCLWMADRRGRRIIKEVKETPFQGIESSTPKPWESPEGRKVMAAASEQIPPTAALEILELLHQTIATNSKIINLIQLPTPDRAAKGLRGSS